LSIVARTGSIVRSMQLFPKASWHLPGLEHREVWTPGIPYDDPVLSELSPGWRLLMLQDGSATRSLSVLTGETIVVDIDAAGEVAEDPNAPPELAQLDKPYLRRSVMLRTRSGVVLSHAVSWWNAADYADFLQDPALPIGTSMERGRAEYCREILSLFLASGRTLDDRFRARGPFLGRHYIMYRGAKALNVIVEIYAPSVARYLDVTGWYPRWADKPD
jgi:chorismate lyase